MTDGKTVLAVLAGGVVLGGLAALVVKVASEPHGSHAEPVHKRREHGKAARRHRRETRTRIKARLERSAY